jgi:alpha-galactosidase
MKHAWLAVCCMVLMQVVNLRAAGQGKAELRTADTMLRFENTPSGPKLIDLSTKDGTAWTNGAAEELPGFVELNGKQVATHWTWNRADSDGHARKIAFVYESASPKLRLTWEWQARADFGPVEHQIRIENLDAQELWLPMVDSLRIDWACKPSDDLEQLYIDKGAGTPNAVGTHLLAVREGYKWEGISTTYAHVEWNGVVEIIPWQLVEHTGGARGGWYVGIEFSGRAHLTLERAGGSLKSVAGLNPNPGPFRTRLKPGDIFETPTVFVGGTTGRPDETGNVLRRWEREVLTNPADWQTQRYPVLVNNSWGSGMAIDEALALRMLRDSAELGFEMFHIDAGWFRGVGDWYPDPKKFPHGLAPIADEAHKLGLKFGLWCDWTQAALDADPRALNVRDPKVNDWVVADTPGDWKPEPFKGQTIDLGVPAARDWAQAEVERMVLDYHLDMLEHDGYVVAQGCARSDHPHAPPDPKNTKIQAAASSFFVESSNSTDVSYHATRAYYQIYSTLRKNHPGLLLEMCNDGGRMVDFGSAAHGDYFSITDTYDPLSNRRAFYDASYVLPPAMLETYVEKWPVPKIENFRYMLRSGMMGWATIMLDTTVWTEEQHKAAKAEFERYKAVLRPFIRNAQLYHISARPDGVHWDGMEYFDPARGKGVVYAFHGSVENERTHVFRLQGVKPEHTYQLHFQDQSSPDTVVKGTVLLEKGLKVALASPNSSELIFLNETKP